MRLETGPAEMPDDWPGVFIRGDNALFFGLALTQHLGDRPKPEAVGEEALKDHINTQALRGLAETLLSCRADTVGDDTQKIDWRRLPDLIDTTVVGDPADVLAERDVPGIDLFQSPHEAGTVIDYSPPQRGPDPLEQATHLLDQAELVLAGSHRRVPGTTGMSPVETAKVLMREAMKRVEMSKMFRLMDERQMERLR
jgi:hypothetical protein